MDFCLLLKIWEKYIAKSITKNLSNKYSPSMLATRQKPLHHVKQSATDSLKTTSKSAIQKKAEVTGDFIGNKSAKKITSFKKFTTEWFRDSWKWNRKYRIW